MAVVVKRAVVVLVSVALAGFAMGCEALPLAGTPNPLDFNLEEKELPATFRNNSRSEVTIGAYNISGLGFRGFTVIEEDCIRRGRIRPSGTCVMQIKLNSMGRENAIFSLRDRSGGTEVGTLRLEA